MTGAPRELANLPTPQVGPAAAGHPAPLSAAAAEALSYPPPGAWMPPLAPGVVRLSAGYPFPESVPTADLLAAAGELFAAERDLPLHYLGSPSMSALPGLLRERMVRRGMSGGEEEVLVTGGACQGIDLAARALLSPGDLVAVEAPTYMEALEIFRNYTRQVAAYPVDEGGLDVAALEQDLRGRRAAGRPTPRLLYTIATFQNPSGATLSLERRRRLLALAEEFDFLILEDDAYGELAFGEAPPTLKALDRWGRVIYLGSLSKVVAPGIRVGWAAGPEAVIQAMGVFKKDLDHPLGWALTARYLARVDLESRLSFLREQYRHRRDLLEDFLAKTMPPGVSWTHPGGGFFLWLTLPQGVDSLALLPAALDAGVAYVPGPHFYPAGSGLGQDRLRLSFSYLPAEEMSRGVEALATVIGGAALATPRS